MEDRIPELGGPMQANLKEMARLALGTKGAVPTARAGQPQRDPDEESSAGEAFWLSDVVCANPTHLSLCYTVCHSHLQFWSEFHYAVDSD